jgi:antitoxin YefM
MDAITYSYARQNMADVMRRVCDDGETIVITSSKRKVVMISLDDYNAMTETDYLLSNPANAAHLRRGIAELAAGRGAEMKLADV